jgi:hypothetical protein
MREELQKVRDWANKKLATGDEPPWAWFQYMKLRETLDQILAGQDATTTESSPQAGEHRGARLQLVDAKYQPDTAQHHQPAPPIPLPM